MTPQPEPQQWIFLEHSENAEKWGVSESGNWSVCANRDSVTTCSLSSIMPSGNEWICILGLADNEEALPETLLNTLQEQNNIGIWCHYGGNIASLGMLGREWKDYKRLSENTKKILVDPKDKKKPIPFSWGQTSWPWNNEFLRIVSLIKKKDTDNLFEAIQLAWSKATDADNLDVKIANLKNALPIVLSLRNLLSSLPTNTDDYNWAEIGVSLENFSKRFGELGVTLTPDDLGERSTPLVKSYINIRTSIITAKNFINAKVHQRTGNNEPELCVNLVNRLRKEIKVFDRCYGCFLKKISTKLARNPNSPQKGI